MDSQQIHIAALHSPKQFRVCEKLQEAIWQSASVDVVPAHVLITAQRHGGLVLGAFEESGQMIGCLFGFAGRVANDNLASTGQVNWQHCSHFTGVIPEWRGRGVGYRLKLAQREWALTHGIELITWTYDPLEAANAALNLGKLGAICRCYLRDFYGEMADGLNAGLPSDRFEVAWWIGSERVRTRLETGWQSSKVENLLSTGVTIINEITPCAGAALEPGPLQSITGEKLLIEIPGNIQAVKATNSKLALAWRLGVRHACEAAFSMGYTCTEVVRSKRGDNFQVFYLLEKGKVE
jgi:predicted GNAT superfamily acetyltransferase